MMLRDSRPGISPSTPPYSSYPPHSPYIRRISPPGSPTTKKCCYEHKEPSFQSNDSFLCCCYTCPKRSSTSVLATMAVCCLVLGYTILGAFIFMALEGGFNHRDTSVAASKSASSTSISSLTVPSSSTSSGSVGSGSSSSSSSLTGSVASASGTNIGTNGAGGVGGGGLVSDLRSQTVDRLWSITENLNILYRENWTRLAAEEVMEFQQALFRALQNGGGYINDGNYLSHQPPHRWTFSSSFLYSLTLITTIGDRLILSTLLRNQYSIEKSKIKLDNYYSIRSMIPEVFQNRLPTNPDIIEMRKILRTFTLPKMVNLRRVIFFVLDEMDHKFSPYTCIAKSILDTEVITYLDLASANELIFDCTNSNFAFWSSFTPTMVKTTSTVVEKIYTKRFGALRIIGLPSFAHFITKTALAFLPDKVKKRITYHSDRLEIRKYYPKEQLPVEYGGSGPSFREMSKDFGEMVDTCTDYLETIQNHKVNE